MEVEQAPVATSVAIQTKDIPTTDTSSQTQPQSRDKGMQTTEDAMYLHSGGKKVTVTMTYLQALLSNMCDMQDKAYHDLEEGTSFMRPSYDMYQRILKGNFDLLTEITVKDNSN